MAKLRDGGPFEIVALAIFLAFLGFAAIMMMNLLVGILCGVVTTIDHESRNEVEIGYIKDVILSALKRFDLDNSGAISNEEMQRVIEDPETRLLFADLKIDMAYLTEYKDLVFSDSAQEIPIQRAMELVTECRGCLPATVSTISHGHLLTRLVLKREMAALHTFLSQEIKRLRKTLRLAHRRGVPSGGTSLTIRSGLGGLGVADVEVDISDGDVSPTSTGVPSPDLSPRSSRRLDLDAACPIRAALPLPKGVLFDVVSGTYLASIRNKETDRESVLGRYDSPEKAHQRYVEAQPSHHWQG